MSLTYGGKANAFHPSKDPGRPGRTLRVQRCGPGIDQPQCEVSRPVNFGGMNWESNLVLVDIERFIMEKGLWLQDRSCPRTLPALAALETHDLDINTEIWLNSVADPWDRA